MDQGNHRPGRRQQGRPEEEVSVQGGPGRRRRIHRADKPDEANVALDKALETAGISGDQVQQAQFLKAQLAIMQNNADQAVALLKKALEASPKSELAPMIQRTIGQLEKAKKPPAPKKPADE